MPLLAIENQTHLSLPHHAVARDVVEDQLPQRKRIGGGTRTRAAVETLVDAH